MGHEGLPVPRLWFASAAMWIAIALMAIDTTIANVALPVIARELGTTASASVWIVNAYQIAITMALFPCAALGERMGYRLVYQVGLIVFLVGSLGCALSGGLWSLTVARCVQGIGAGGVMAVNGAIVRFTFSKASMGRGIGHNALVIAVATAAGPALAAGILEIAAWPWLFAINLPVGLLSLVIGWRTLPEQRGTVTPFDWRQALLSAAAIGVLALGFARLSHLELGPATFLQIASGTAAFAVMLRSARAQRHPILPVDLLGFRELRLAYLVSALTFAAQMMAMIALPFFLHAQYGFDTATVGLVITPWAIAVGITAFASGRLLENFPLEKLVFVGLVVFAIGLMGIALMPDSASLAALAACSALSGAGFGLFQTPNNRTMLAASPYERSGAAGGMQAAARLVGQTAGAAFAALALHLAGPAARSNILVAVAISSVAALTALFKARKREESRESR
ncbi:MFS transporter [Sphingomonas sp. AP4-R1]|uniref:MFS transporter n=1 Tax=Sphingomonas sp. AP4-R1 TaxID=2735134 RepID=UPI001493BFED|nr:MFS transporter [Sphingomonas sp. AP4-R1]QJU58180.1 MFS transporter [Sphingomonas sp. AP4-R1]